MGTILKVTCLILAAIVVISIIGSIGYIAVKAVLYIINQHMSFSMSFEWAWQDYLGLFQAQAENEENPDFWESEYTVNRYIEVKACTSL